MGAWYSKALLAEIQTGRKPGNGADGCLGLVPITCLSRFEVIKKYAYLVKEYLFLLTRCLLMGAQKCQDARLPKS
jgi:hypothetical protein